MNPNPILAVDFSGKVTFHNQATIQTLEKLGFTEAAAFLPKDIGAIINLARQGKETWFYREVRLGNRVFGEDLHVNKSSRAVHIYGLDITEWQEAKEELKRHRIYLETIVRESTGSLREMEEQFRALAESASDAVIFTDALGSIIFWNKSAQTLFGYTAEEVLGQSVNLLIPERYLEAHLRAMERLRNHGESQIIGKTVELEGLKKDGTEFPLELSLSSWETGKGIFFSAIIRDITQRKLMEEELLKEKTLADVTINSLPGIFYFFDEQGKMLRWNENLERVSGYSPEEIGRMNPLDFFVGEDKRLTEAHIRKVFLEGEGTNEAALLAKDGSRIPYFFTCRQTRLEGKDYLVGMGVEISDRKQAEETLQKTNAALQALISASPLSIFVLDAEGRVQLWNPASEHIFGWEKDEVIGRILPIVPEEKINEFQGLLQRSLRGESLSGVELTRRTKSGNAIEISIYTAPLFDSEGKVTGIMALIADITQRRQAEAELQHLRHHHELILNATGEGILGLDPNGVVTFVNPAAARMLGYEVGELLGCHSHSTFHHSKRDGTPFPFAECPIYQAVEKGKACCVFSDEVFWRKDGASFPVEYSIAPIMEHGEIAGGVVTFRDISQRQEAEALAKSLIETSPVGVYLLRNGKFILTNHWFHLITGYSEEELSRLDFWNLVHPNDRFGVKANALMMLQGKSFTPYQYRTITKGGEIRWVMETVTSIRYKGERSTLGYFMDITERRELEDKLLHAQKMEAVGRLAGGVAHDFNNMLMAIMGYAEMILEGLRLDDPLHRKASGIMKATDRAAALTRQLLAFSRKQILQPQVINLNAVVNDTRDMLRRLIGEDIELVTVLDPSLGNVKADPGQIEQVIMNLAVNARDAMPQGGKLAIQTGNIEFIEPYDCKFEIAAPGHYAVLAVSDTGEGMDERTQANLFEPFYTTKELGKGTGLGLSTVYGIVKQSDGCIEVQSQPGVGTTFKIYLPLVQEAIAAVETMTVTRLRGSETILVVEDDDMVRQLIVDALGLYGYKILPASNGGEALLLCERHREPIQLMLTDVVMPHMSGRELAERLAPLHPEMKVLYMSGYTEEIVGPRGVLQKGALFIQKPFTPTILVRKVRQVLDARDGNRHSK
jgi:PAS domain S-box-containing protein